MIYDQQCDLMVAQLFRHHQNMTRLNSIRLRLMAQDGPEFWVTHLTTAPDVMFTLDDGQQKDAKGMSFGEILIFVTNELAEETSLYLGVKRMMEVMGMVITYDEPRVTEEQPL